VPQLTLQDAIAHPFIQQHCALLYTTASHTEDWHRFRMVFPLPEFISDTAEYEALVQYLMEQLPHDPSCSDASRVFYGNTDALFAIVNPDAHLPQSWVEQARAAAAEAKAQRQQQLEAAARKRAEFQQRAQSEGWDVDELIQQALAYIPPREPGSGNYQECLTVLMALVDHYGDFEAESIAELWSPSLPGTSWNIPRKIRSFRRGGVTIGSLFHIAKAYGFRFPKKSWLSQIGDRLNRKLSPEASAEALKKTLQDTPFSGHEYEPGDRAATWQWAIGEGYRFILDRSGTGTGKSHDTGNLRPGDFGDKVRHLWYLSPGHYSPTTETLQEWPDLHGRHNGLTREATTGGTRLRRAKRGEDRVMPANCSRNGIINALRAKNVAGADSAGVVCGTCPLKDACSHSQGNGFGFLNQRKTALISERLRLHPDSAPGDDYDYSKVLAIWDEPSESFKASTAITVTVEDIDRTIGHLAIEAPELFAQLRPFLGAIKQLFALEQGRYGLSHQAILEALPTLPEIDINALSEALRPNLDFLDPEVAEGVRVSDLPGRSVKFTDTERVKQKRKKSKAKQEDSSQKVVIQEGIIGDYATDLTPVPAKEDEPPEQPRTRKKVFGRNAKVNLRSHYNEDSEAQRDKAESTVLKQWLVDLVKLITTGAGALHLSWESLTITRPNFRHRAIANATVGNIFLDATLSREDLALMLGCAPTDIYVCRQRSTVAQNLKITQVSDLGRVSMQRGKLQEERIAALIDHYRAADPNTRVIDFKKFNADGAWWRDSRGVNDFTGTTTLLLVGTPCRNVAALQAEYACLTGQFPDKENEDFAAWCDRIIQADMLQGIGRLRATRRPGEQLHVVLLSNFALGLPVQEVAAKDITPKAASKTERVELAIRGAVERLKQAGEKVTQTAVARIIGHSQGYVARFKKLLQTLLVDTNSKSNNSEADPPPSSGDVLNILESALELPSSMAELEATLEDLLVMFGSIAESPPPNTQEVVAMA
jgi:hypothetical protein